MTPGAYIDVGLAREGERGDPRIASAVYARLHGIMRAHPGRFAVAFPRADNLFSLLRVFASSPQELEAMAKGLRDGPAMGANVRIGEAKTVPTGFAGPWQECRRYRIPSRRADRRPGAPCRARRLQEADRQQIPYLLMHSASTGQYFSLHFDVRTFSENHDSAQPDGYGLSRASAPFCVPHLPA